MGQNIKNILKMKISSNMCVCMCVYVYVYMYISPYCQLREAQRRNRSLDRKVQNEIILELKAAKGEGRRNICV